MSQGFGIGADLCESYLWFVVGTRCACEGGGALRLAWDGVTGISGPRYPDDEGHQQEFLFFGLVVPEEGV